MRNFQLPVSNFQLIKDLKNHFWHYIVLILIMAVGGIAFLSSPANNVKFQIGILTALAYIGWGIFHHLLENNLNLKIVVEYSLIAVLATILLGGTLL